MTMQCGADAIPARQMVREWDSRISLPVELG